MPDVSGTKVKRDHAERHDRHHDRRGDGVSAVRVPKNARESTASSPPAATNDGSRDDGPAAGAPQAVRALRRTRQDAAAARRERMEDDMGDYVMQRMREANGLVHRAGPYVLLEILLPGGTLIALLLFLYRRHHAGVPFGFSFGWVRTRLEDALDLRVVADPDHDPAQRDGLEPLGLVPGA